MITRRVSKIGTPKFGNTSHKYKISCMISERIQTLTIPATTDNISLTGILRNNITCMWENYASKLHLVAEVFAAKYIFVKMIQIPRDKKITEGEIATYWME